MKVLTEPPPAHIAIEAQAPSGRAALRRASREHPLLRAGLFAWATVGVAAAAMLALWVLWRLRLVVIPLTLALFPAAVLAPASRWLTAHRIPRTLSAFAVLLAALGLIGGGVTLLVPQVSGQLDSLRSSLGSGLNHVEQFLGSGPFGLPPVRLEQIVSDLRPRATGDGSLLTGLLGVAHFAAEAVVGALLGLIALFFYLRDGRALFGWLRDLWPERLRGDVQRVGKEIWATIGSYIRGQLAVGATNAVLVAVGLVALGVPLVLPLAALIFAGSLFPVVGILIAGALPVLVALAEVGPVTAALTLALIVVVHEVEVHVLAPLIQSRALHLHPLAIIVSLTAGAALLGVLGAFIAVPVTASVANAVAYVRNRSLRAAPAGVQQ